MKSMKHILILILTSSLFSMSAIAAKQKRFYLFNAKPNEHRYQEKCSDWELNGVKKLKEVVEIHEEKYGETEISVNNFYPKEYLFDENCRLTSRKANGSEGTVVEYSSKDNTSITRQTDGTEFRWVLTSSFQNGVETFFKEKFYLNSGKLAFKTAKKYFYDDKGLITKYVEYGEDGKPTWTSTFTREKDKVVMYSDTGQYHYKKEFYFKDGHVVSIVEQQAKLGSDRWFTKSQEESLEYYPSGSLKYEESNIYHKGKLQRFLVWRYDENGLLTEYQHHSSGAFNSWNASASTYTYKLDAKANWIERYENFYNKKGKNFEKVTDRLQVTKRDIEYY